MKKAGGIERARAGVVGYEAIQRGRTNRSQAGDCIRTDLIAPVRPDDNRLNTRRMISTAHHLTDRMPPPAQLQTDRKTFVSSKTVTRE